MTDKAISILLQRFFQDDLNEAERERLARWINEQDKDAEIKVLLEKSWNDFKPNESIPTEKAEMMLRSILTRAKEHPSTKHRAIVKSIFWKRIAVAASVILVTLVATNYFFKQEKEPKAIVKTQTLQDVKAPETNRAMITLANGQRIYLDSVGNGSLAIQGNVQLLKMANGQIGYQIAEGKSTSELIYNTLSNPRGSKVINMALSDGSHVWLNAGSSLTYPVAFSNKERKVSVTGEAYFEIEHDARKPFYVSKSEMSVRVLGTHFNVNSYDDEDAIRVTLLEGKVNVVLAGETAVLTPGEQAQIKTTTKKIQTVSGVDIDQVMAWKNGLFSFERVGVKEVMNQLSRWYDVDVEYRGNIPDLTFGGDIQRSLNLSQVLEVLEKSGVHFKMEGKKIIVLP